MFASLGIYSLQLNDMTAINSESSGDIRLLERADLVPALVSKKRTRKVFRLPTINGADFLRPVGVKLLKRGDEWDLVIRPLSKREFVTLPLAGLVRLALSGGLSACKQSASSASDEVDDEMLGQMTLPCCCICGGGGELVQNGVGLVCLKCYAKQKAVTP